MARTKKQDKKVRDIGEITAKNKAREQGTSKETLAGESTEAARLSAVNESRINRGMKTITAKDLPENVGKIGTGDGKTNGAKADEIAQEEDVKGGLESAAGKILTPIAGAGNIIGKGIEATTGVGFTEQTGEELAETTTGKVLAGGIAATGGALIAVGGAAAVGAIGASTAAIGTALGLVYATNEFLLSPSELATWAAVDNVAGATSFQVSGIVRGLQEGSLSREEANNLIDQAEKNIVGSRAFVNKTTMLNPKLWASRKILMKSIETADDSIQILKLRLNQ